MANDASKNPIRIDTEGLVTTRKVRVVAFNVDPSSTSWEVELHSTGASWGGLLFRSSNSADEPYGLPLPFPKPTKGIWAVTLTNVNEVDVYTDEGD